MNAVEPNLAIRPAGSDAHGRRRIGDIEMLRGIAVAMVVLEHLPFALMTWPSGFLAFTQRYFVSWTGVDLFFGISGFVIGRNLLPSIDIAGDRLAYFHATLVFWTRRAWRLLPSAWLWILLPFAASVGFNRGGFFESPSINIQDGLAAFLNVFNFYFAQYFGQQAFSVVFPYWSLSLEEQFYLALPVLIFVFRRYLAWLLLAVAVLQFQVSVFPIHMLNRHGGLAAGVLLAIWSGTASYRLCEPHALASHPAARWTALAAGLILLGALGSDQLTIVTFRLGLIMLVAAALVWLATYDRDYLMRKGSLKRVLVWLGSRSYGIYLVHVFAFTLTRELWLRLSPAGTVFDAAYAWRFGLTALALILGLSELNHRFVEQPLRRRGGLIADRMAQRQGMAPPGSVSPGLTQ